jgi:hypothetical protein
MVSLRPGGFGGDVARREAGAAGGQDQVGLGGVVTQRVGDLADLIGQRGGCGGGDAFVQQHLHQGGAGAVHLRPGGAAIADREDDGADARIEAFSHFTSLTGLNDGRV